MALKPTATYVAACSVVVANPLAAEFVEGILASVALMLADADVLPTGNTPPLTAPPMGGPVTGKGKLG